MKVNGYLVATVRQGRYNQQSATLRVTKQQPKLAANELAFNLSINIPDTMFKRLIPVVKIDVPGDMLVNPNPDIALSLTAASVAEALRLDVKTVEDGLKQMLTDKEKNNGEE